MATAALVLLIVLSACSSPPPDQSPIPSALPSALPPAEPTLAADQFPLRTQPRQTEPPLCMAALLEGVLVANPKWGLAVVASFGIEQVIWPFGYAGRLGNPSELLDERGKPVARAGDRIRIGGGEIADGVWLACPGTVETVGGS